MSADSSDTVSLHRAAELLGVHYMTAYRYIRLGILNATKVGGSWRIDAVDLDRIRVHGPSRSPVRSAGQAPADPDTRQPAPWTARLSRRLIAGDVEGSWQVVEAAMSAGVSPADVYVGILGPALHAIGEAWRQGEIGIEQEHVASGIATSIVGRLGPRFRKRGRQRGTIVVAMPTGERHGLGASMLSDILRGDGHAVLNLGPDTPPASLAAAMSGVDDLFGVVVSVADVHRLPAARRLIFAARRQDPDAVVIAGGFAIADAGMAHAIGADGWTADPRSLARLFSELLAR
jgi:excisionase family DNA binding protein